MSEQEEGWAQQSGFHELVVKTKNKFYGMRATLDRLRFDIIKFEPNALDNLESKLYLSKKLLPTLIEQHKTLRTVVAA